MTDDTSTLSSSVDENDTLNYLEEDDTDLENSNTTKKSPGAFRTISEVADEIHVPQHVLRFWESRFTQVQPVKRSGGRRYYRAEDIELLRYISELLYVHGYTIKGVQRLLKEDFSRFEEKKETEEEVVQTDTIASEEIIDQQDAEDINQDQSSSQQHDYVVDNYLQEIEKLKKENVFLVNSLEGILLELNELRKIVLNS